MITKRTTTNEKLLEIAALFFKLGCISFGGPAAHIAMMEDEVVDKRHWMSREHFLDLIGATNLIPGPNSTEMTMHCGYERGGWKGLFIAGMSFILPAVFITGIFAWLYVEYGQLPEVEPYIYGIKPAVIAIILMAAYRLSKKALKNVMLGILGAIGLIACLAGVNEIAVLFLGGLAGVLWYFITKPRGLATIIAPLLLYQGSEQQLSTLKIALAFLKIGAILYGSGYVLFAFLDAELVANGWLSRQALIDAVAVGQFTPGPVLSTATFIGYQLNGIPGAIAATTGIFLPSFLFVLLLNPLIPKMRNSGIFSALLDAVNITAVALILAVTVEMGKETLTDWKTSLIAVLALILVFIFRKINAAFIVIGGALLGYLLYWI